MKITQWPRFKTIATVTGTVGLAGALSIGFQLDREPRPQSLPTQSEVGPISCQIALSPHAGNDDIDKRIIRYQQLARTGPAADAYLERLGWAFVAKARAGFDSGFYTLARQTAACLESKRPHDKGAQLLLGHVLHNQHRFVDSERIAKTLVAQRGSWTDYGLLGDALTDQGRLDEAVDAYQQMLNRHPGPQAYLRAAHLRWLKGDVKGAIDMMNRTSASIGSRDKASTAWVYVQLASYLWLNRQYDSAQAHLKRSLALQPDYPPALLLQGRIALHDGEYSKAAELLSRAVRVNPLPRYQWVYWEALQQTGDFDRAAAVHRNLIEKGALLDRRSFSLYLASTRQNPEMALNLAREELTVRRDVFTLDALAWALRANGRLEEAYRYTQKALAEGTIDGGLFFHAAIIAGESGNAAVACRLYRRLQSIRPLLLPSELQVLATRFAETNPQNCDSTIEARFVESHFNPTGDTL